MDSHSSRAHLMRQTRAAGWLSDGPMPIPGICDIIKSYGKELAGTCGGVLAGHTCAVWALASMPNGMLASGSADHTARVWNINEGSCLRTLFGHTGGILALAALPDGSLVSGSQDNTLRTWDVDRGDCAKSNELCCRPRVQALSNSDYHFFANHQWSAASQVLPMPT